MILHWTVQKVLQAVNFKLIVSKKVFFTTLNLWPSRWSSFDILFVHYLFQKYCDVIVMVEWIAVMKTRVSKVPFSFVIFFLFDKGSRHFEEGFIGREFNFVGSEGSLHHSKPLTIPSFWLLLREKTQQSQHIDHNTFCFWYFSISDGIRIRFGLQKVLKLA